MKRLSWLLALIMLVTFIPTGVWAEDYGQCDHDWDDWEIVRRSTIKRQGVATRSCWECGATQKKYIRKLKPFAKMKKKASVKVGKKIKLKVKYARGDKVKKWKTNRKALVSVSKTGKVTGKKAGKARVTAILRSGKRATCIVTVKAVKKKPAPKKGGGSKSGGSGTVYWTPSGSVYHKSRGCPTLSRSRTVYSGTIAQSGKPRCCKVCG